MARSMRMALRFSLWVLVTIDHAGIAKLKSFKSQLGVPNAQRSHHVGGRINRHAPIFQADEKTMSSELDEEAGDQKRDRAAEEAQQRKKWGKKKTPSSEHYNYWVVPLYSADA
ncbi:hypothetical protein B0H19DRAFT_1083533 [Mycena capillaripes]|nr:hypothetical protein B0H19DRAFT_1083533 [Mycena capillaripes]